MTTIFSLTPNGAAQTSMPAGATIYGRLINAPALNVQACTHVTGTTGCSSPPTNWVTFPANGWTYDAPSSTWRQTFAPNSFPPGQYTAFARNASTGQMASPFTFTLTGPTLIYSATFNGPAATTFSAGATVYGRITGSILGQTQGCAEPSGNTACNNLSVWGNLPNADWTWDAASSTLRTVVAPNTFPPGSYVVYVRDTVTDSRATPVTLTLTGPAIIYSQTLNGPPQTVFSVSASFHGRIVGTTLGQTEACAEAAGGTQCQNLGVWGALPNPDWSWDASTSTLRSLVTPGSLPVGSYTVYVRDTATGARAAPVTVTIQ